jgi:hypothetical protein
MVDGREKSELYHAYDRAIGELGLHVLQTVLPDSKRFRRVRIIQFHSIHNTLTRTVIYQLCNVNQSFGNKK